MLWVKTNFTTARFVPFPVFTTLHGHLCSGYLARYNVSYNDSIYQTIGHFFVNGTISFLWTGNRTVSNNNHEFEVLHCMPECGTGF